jgi:hypothetical protein
MSVFSQKSIAEVNDDVDGTSGGTMEFKVDANQLREEMELVMMQASSSEAFTTCFEKEVKSIVQLLNAEQIRHEMMAKALLKDILSQSKVPDGPVNMMADKLGASYKRVELHAAEACKCLGKIAFEADKALGTSCLSLLERSLGDAEASTAFIVVLSDIYDAGRAANKVQDGKPKWEAPAAFERETTKYW